MVHVLPALLVVVAVILFADVATAKRYRKAGCVVVITTIAIDPAQVHPQCR